MNKKVKIDMREYRFLRRSLEKVIRIDDVSERWKRGRDILKSFYYRHCMEISPLYFHKLNGVLTQMNWGTSYWRRYLAYCSLMKVLREEYLQVIEFEEVNYG